MLKHYRHRRHQRSAAWVFVTTLLMLTLAGWDSGGMIDSGDQPAWFGRVQVIHNAPDAGQIDLYVDGRRVWNDAAFQTATPYMPMAHGTPTIEVVAGADPDNSHPLFSPSLTVRQGVNYVVTALGLVNPDTGEPAFKLVVEDKARLESASVKYVDFLVVHGAPCLGEIDVRVLDAVRDNQVVDLLINNLGFGEVSAYKSLAAGMGHNIEIVSSDGEEQLDVFRLESPVQIGETLVLTPSCPDPGTTDGLTMMGVEVDGSVFLQPVITAVEEAVSGALPEMFARLGNYPNPFNPSTTIQFDLAQTASVSVEIVDMLGRRVMTLPARPMEAGAARTLEVDAAHLASGAYLYHLSARTSTATTVKTGWMMLVR